MQKNLHQIYPAATYTSGGVLTTIPLSCAGNVKSRIAKVLLHIITPSPLTVEEVSQWGANVIPATKITNACTSEVVYVAEYFNDVFPFLYCCSGDEEIPPGEEVPPASTFAYQFAVRNSNLSKSIRIKTSTTTIVTVEWNAVGVGQFVQSQSGTDMLFTCNNFQINGASNYQRIFCDTPENITWIEFIDAQVNTLPSTVPLTSLQTLIANDNVVQLNSVPILTPSLLFLDFSNCIIGVSEISTALQTLDTNGLINGTADFSGQTPPAVPNFAGQTAKTNLIGKGWICLTD